MSNLEAQKEAFQAEEKIFSPEFYRDIFLIEAILGKAKAYLNHGEPAIARFHLHLALDSLERLQRQYLDLLPEVLKKNFKKAEMSAELLLRLQKLCIDSARTLDEERYLWKENITIIKMMLAIFQFAMMDQNYSFGKEVLRYAEEMLALQAEHYNKNEKEDDSVMPVVWVDFRKKTCLFRDILGKREALGVKDPKIEDAVSEDKNLQNPYPDQMDICNGDNENHILAHDIGERQNVHQQHASAEQHNELENVRFFDDLGVQPIPTKTVTREPPAWLGMNGYEKETEEWLATIESSSSSSGSGHCQMNVHLEVPDRIANEAGPLTLCSESFQSSNQEVAYDLVELRRQFQKEERFHIAGKRLVLRLKHLEFVLDLYNTLPDDNIIIYAREIIALAKGKRKATDGHFGDNNILEEDELRNLSDDVCNALKEYYLRLFMRMRVGDGLRLDEEVMNTVTNLLQRVDRKKANKEELT